MPDGMQINLEFAESYIGGDDNEDMNTQVMSSISKPRLGNLMKK